MPSLERTFVDYDLPLLRALAGELGLVLVSGNARDAAGELAEAMFDEETLALAFSGLAAEALQALSVLAANHGQLPAAVFDRRFGELRPLGAGAREREQPWRNPANITEALHYRGLLGRAFLPDEGDMPQEYVYIPDEINFFLPEIDLPPVEAAPAHQTGAAPQTFISASSALVDDATTLLAWLQREQPDTLAPAQKRALQPWLIKPAALDFLYHLLRAADLIGGDPPLKPDAKNARPFLDDARGPQLQRLIATWRTTSDYDDLAHVPGLVLDFNAPARNPVVVRDGLFGWLAELPVGEWWLLDEFVATVKASAPDFQRPGGNYDSLYIRAVDSKDYLRGFETWEQVDGALLRYLISGPLHWLGLADITRPDDAVPRFRLTQQVFEAVATGRPLDLATPDQPITIKPDGHVWATRAANRYDRFQMARIADWVLREERYLYRITANSLDAAAERGVTPQQVLAFLRKAVPDMPPELLQAIERWGQVGAEAWLGQLPVLRVNSQVALDQLRQTPSISELLGEQIGPLAVVVPPRNWDALQDELLRLGVLLARDE